MSSEAEGSFPALPPGIDRVLFVCTGNSCRSVMAEGLFNRRARDKALPVKATSAGISAIDGMGSTEETILALKNAGVDMAHHRSRRLTKGMVQDASLVLAMDMMHYNYILQIDPESKEKVFLMTDFYRGMNQKLVADSVPDPIGMNHEFYTNVMNIIRESVDTLFELLPTSSTETQG